MSLSFASEGTGSSFTKFALDLCTTVFLPSASFLSCLESVSVGFLLPWDMINLHVVPLQYVNPFPDTGIDAHLVWEMTELSVVHLNHHRVGPSAIVFPLGKCPHYAKKFPLIGTVPHFHTVQLFVGKDYGLQAIAKVLLQDSTNYHITYISDDYKLSIKVWKLQDRSWGQCQLQLVERLD